MVSTIEQCDARFLNAASEVSAHMGVALNGRVHQYVIDQAAAWSNGPQYAGNAWSKLLGIDRLENPNYYTLSIETEDLGTNAPISSQQYRSTKALCRMWMKQHPSIKYLVAHRAISPTVCPAPRWMDTGLFMRLAGELGLVAVP